MVQTAAFARRLCCRLAVRPISTTRLRWMPRFGLVRSRARTLTSQFRCRSADSWAALRTTGRAGEIPPAEVDLPQQQRDVVDTITALLTDAGERESGERGAEQIIARRDMLREIFADVDSTVPAPSHRLDVPNVSLTSDQINAIREAIQSNDNSGEYNAALEASPFLEPNLRNVLRVRIPNRQLYSHEFFVGCARTVCIGSVQLDWFRCPCVCLSLVAPEPLRTNFFDGCLRNQKGEFCLRPQRGWQPRNCRMAVPSILGFGAGMLVSEAPRSCSRRT